MTRIYFYKLRVDNGGAPCVQSGLLSLAICKPGIRSKAQCGDLIFGFAANSLRPRDNRLIYAARVHRKLSNGEYYKESRYAGREDRIYKFKARRFVRRKDAQHHVHAWDLSHDLGDYPKYRRACVLLSTDFRYFGKASSDEYKNHFPRVRHAVEQLGRGYRVHHGAELQEELLEMEAWVWQSTHKKKSGLPTSAPSRRACHR
jgi:putative DNA base modification enzyme with NMAD domain